MYPQNKLVNVDIRTQPPTCMQPPMNMHTPEYGACLQKQQPLSYMGMQQLVYTGVITSYIGNQTKYLIA